MLFTNTTHLRAVERQMKQIPNFNPRRSGLRIIGLPSDDYDKASTRISIHHKNMSNLSVFEMNIGDIHDISFQIESKKLLQSSLLIHHICLNKNGKQ